MITKWKDALASYDGVVLEPDGTGNDHGGMRSDLKVYRSSVPIIMDNRQITYYLFESYHEGYRCFPAYNVDNMWWGADDDRLGGDDRSSSELIRTTQGSLDEAVLTAEAKLSSVFING